MTPTLKESLDKKLAESESPYNEYEITKSGIKDGLPTRSYIQLHNKHFNFMIDIEIPVKAFDVPLGELGNSIFNVIKYGIDKYGTKTKDSKISPIDILNKKLCDLGDPYNNFEVIEPPSEYADTESGVPGHPIIFIKYKSTDTIVFVSDISIEDMSSIHYEDIMQDVQTDIIIQKIKQTVDMFVLTQSE